MAPASLLHDVLREEHLASIVLTDRLDGLTMWQVSATMSEVTPKVQPLSEQVRSAVDRSGLSRYRICAEIELDESAMSRFMSGERGLSMEVLDRLGLHLGLTLRPVKPAKRAKGT